VLKGLGLLELFSQVIGGDTAYGRKPDPAGLLALAGSAGLGPEQTMLVGDSPIDLATARRAGARICLARYGFGFRFNGSDFDGSEAFIDEPRALPDVLARLERQI
jgi:phosphoglycolate phosphatase